MEDKEYIYVYRCDDGQRNHTKVFRDSLMAMGYMLRDYNKRIEDLKLWCIENRKNIERYSCVLSNDHAFIQDLDNIDSNTGCAFALYEATVRCLPIE